VDLLEAKKHLNMEDALLYTLMLLAVSLLPFVTGMSGGIYLVDTGRINVCGITDNNVQYLAESIALGSPNAHSRVCGRR